MLTKAERKSAGIAKRLVKALADIEEYDGNPMDVLDDAGVSATQYKPEVTKLVDHLVKYYAEDGE